jgi:hypothetical protein
MSGIRKTTRRTVIREMLKAPLGIRHTPSKLNRIAEIRYVGIMVGLQSMLKKY